MSEELKSDIIAILQPYVDRMKLLEAHFHMAVAYRATYSEYLDTGDEKKMQSAENMGEILDILEQAVLSEYANRSPAAN